MALRCFFGFDDVALVKYPEWDALLTPVTGRDGVALHGCNINGNTMRTMTPPGGSIATMIVGMAVDIGSAPGSTSVSLPNFFNGATALGTLNFDVTGKITFRTGGPTGTIIATASGSPLVVGVPRYIEIKYTPSTTSGLLVVRVDEVEVINMSGVATSAGAGPITTSQWRGANAIALVDDMYVLDGIDGTATDGRPNNDFLGDCRVAHGLPTSDGATVTLTPSTGTNHAALVDDPSANTTDYVSGLGGGGSTNKDLFNFTDLPAEAATIFGVRVGLFAAKTDAGTANFKTLIRESGGAETAGTAQALSTTYAGYYSGYHMKAAGGSPFTPAEVNALQAGAQIA